jgi:prepilin-type N-terminal cleavage/methylation domain-containing protein
MNKKGFTLIEVLIALSIIAIMIFSVTPLIVFSLKSIADTGKTSGSLFDSKGTVDVNIAEKEASSASEIPVRFMSEAATAVKKVSGGLAEKEVINTFVADAPSISLAPFVLNEGYAGATSTATYITIQIVGTNTHFKSGSTTLSVKDKDGFDVSGVSSLTVSSTTSASFRLPLGISNAKSPLTVKLSTNVYVGAADVKNETERTDLTVNLPRYLAVGVDGTNIITDNKTNWYARTSGLSAQMNSIAWGNNRFISVGNSGGLYCLANGSNWSALTTGITNNINRVIWTGDSFIAVGSSGLIIFSVDGETWNSATSSVAAQLNGIAYNGSVYIAVGNNGTILTSSDKSIWTTPGSITGLGSTNLNDVVWCNNQFIAVGDNGTVMTSLDGSIWSKVSISYTGQGTPPGNFRKLKYNSTTIVTISSNGKIFTSADGNTWTYRNSGVSSSSTELNDIIWNDGSFIVVGANGTIITSANGTSWSNVTSPTTKRLLGLCNR